MSESGLLSFGLVSGRPVFMDERQDSYFRLEESTEAEFLDLVKSNGTVTASASADLRAALGASHGSPRIVLAQPPQACRSLLDEIGPVPKARIRDAVIIARLLRRARTSIAKRPIGEILSGLAQDARTQRRLDGDIEITAGASRFISGRRLVPYALNCLTDSLALMHWLGRSPGALLVFGAKLEPFAAHCWVQLGDLLLNDRTDVVAQFRPVRVI